jgi:hypothetical protein
MIPETLLNIYNSNFSSSCTLVRRFLKEHPEMTRVFNGCKHFTKHLPCEKQAQLLADMCGMMHAATDDADRD